MDALHRCINELCYQCGKYEMEHEGACEGCEWFPKKYEPIKSNDELMRDMADDLMFHCETRGCYDEDEDGHGHIWYRNPCPFLEKTDDLERARCLIGDPSSWVKGW